MIALGGCCMAPVQQAIDEGAIEKVQADIKRQIWIYMKAAETPPAGIANQTFWCGKGKIDFDISQVKAELTTTNEAITNAGLSLKVPVNLVTLKPSGSAKVDVTNTEVLTYNLWPLALTPGEKKALKTSPPTEAEMNSAPIALTLISLRDALIYSASKKNKGPQPCFTDYNPDKPSSDAGNSVKLGLSIVTDSTGGIEVDVGVLTLTATGESKGTTGNTLTVSFVQRDLSDIQRAKDRVDAECKYPKDNAGKPCIDAMDALKKQQGIGTGVNLQ